MQTLLGQCNRTGLALALSGLNPKITGKSMELALPVKEISRGYIARPIGVFPGIQALKRVSEHRETSAKEMPSSIMSVARAKRYLGEVQIDLLDVAAIPCECGYP